MIQIYFTMSVQISENTLQFLSNLALNNNKDWFTENKAVYTNAQQNMISFIENLITEMGSFDEEILKIDPKKTLFRIYKKDFLRFRIGCWVGECLEILF